MTLPLTLTRLLKLATLAYVVVGAYVLVRDANGNTGRTLWIYAICSVIAAPFRDVLHGQLPADACAVGVELLLAGCGAAVAYTSYVPQQWLWWFACVSAFIQLVVGTSYNVHLWKLREHTTEAAETLM